MIEINSKAVPYLTAGSALACVSTLSFFKGVSAIMHSFNSSSEKEERRSRFQKIFNVFAWMGLSALSGYGCYQVQHSFFKVPSLPYNDAYLKPFSDDIQEYRAIFHKFFNEQDSLRNFCLAGFESKIGLSALEQSEGSRLQMRQSPKVKWAEAALRFVRGFDQNADFLKSDLDRREGRLKAEFESLRADLGHRKVARGVYLNFNKICDSAFGYFAPRMCASYNAEKEYLNQYKDFRVRVDFYKEGVISEQQFARCQEAYNFSASLEEVTAGENIQDLVQSKEGGLRSIVRSVFG